MGDLKGAEQSLAEQFMRGRPVMSSPSAAPSGARRKMTGDDVEGGFASPVRADQTGD